MNFKPLSPVKSEQNVGDRRPLFRRFALYHNIYFFFSAARSCAQQDLCETLRRAIRKKCQLPWTETFIFHQICTHVRIPVHVSRFFRARGAGRAHWSSLTASVRPIYLRRFIAGTCLPTRAIFLCPPRRLFPRSSHDYDDDDDDLIHIIFGTCVHTLAANAEQKHILEIRGVPFFRNRN